MGEFSSLIAGAAPPLQPEALPDSAERLAAFLQGEPSSYTAEAIGQPVRLAQQLLAAEATFAILGVGEQSRVQAWAGCPEGITRGLLCSARGAASLSSHVSSSSAALIVPDCSQKPMVEWWPELRLSEPIALLGLPIFVDREPAGAICVVDRGPRAWSKDDICTATELARALERELTACLRNPREAAGREFASAELWGDEKTLELAESSAGIGIWDVELATGFARGRPQFFRIMGLDPTSRPVPIETFRALRHPDDLRRVLEGYEHALASGAESYEVEYRIRRPDGQTRWIFGRGRLVRDANGKPVRYSGVDIDITDRKTSEAALAATEQRYRELVEHANDLVATLDQDFRFLSVNPAVERILGYKPQEVIGATIERFIPASQLEFHRMMLQRKIHGGADTRYEMEIVGKSGDRFTLEVNSRLVRSTQDGPPIIHVIARDVTERKHGEARQALLVRELQHRTRNILAVVQSIVTNTLRRSSNPRSARETIEGRLQALARAHDCVSSGPGGGVAIRELIAAELATFPARTTIEGPEVIAGSGFAQMFALVIHELATNAAKYGALSAPRGIVHASWRVVGFPPDDKLEFKWVERGGPPVRPPETHGFGTRLISTALSGAPRLSYGERGLEFAIEVPLNDVAR